MKRKLYTQVRNEWRTNVWLAVELLVVSVVLWYIYNDFIAAWQIESLPDSYDTENCFLVEVNDINPDSKRYVSYDGEEAEINQAICDDMTELMSRLRRQQGIESLSLIGTGTAVPNSMNGNYWRLYAADGLDSTVVNHANMMIVDPDYFKVFRMSGANGETPEEMSALLKDDTVILSENVSFTRNPSEVISAAGLFPDLDYTPAKELVGRVFAFNSALEGSRVRVAGLVKPYKRIGCEYPTAGMILSLEERHKTKARQILLRTTPEAAEGFSGRILDDADKHFHVGNLIIDNVTSLDEIRRTNEEGMRNGQIALLVLLLFLLISIFLGILGTFWFRTQQRVGEIAIRKACGAGNMSVLRRLMSEGMLILLVVTPLALVFDWLLTHYQLNSSFPEEVYFQPQRFALSVLFSFLSLTLMIILGIWFPARKAMQIDPAIALKDE